jgi:phosphoribosyl 1,2-cyclic phosphate phosphodiesterase
MKAETIRALRGVDLMILDALRHKPHATHLTVADSVALLRRIGASRSYLIHMCHDLDHEETQKSLPRGVWVSCDGLMIEV